MIYNTSTNTNCNIDYNNIHNISKTGASGTIYAIRAGTAIYSISNNQIYDITIPNTSGTSAGVIYGIYNLASATYENYSYNTIYNLSVSGSSTSTSAIIQGIYSFTVAGSTKLLNNNLIYGLQYSASGSVAIAGIRHNAGNAAISYNKIYNLKATTGTASYVTGILIDGGATQDIYNNYVYDIVSEANTSATAPGTMGIRLSAGTLNNLSYNSVYLNAAGTAANYSTAGLYIAGGTTNETRNNIIVNESVPGATGKVVAVWKTSTGTTNFGANSNKNIYYAGVPDASHLIGYFSTTAYSTLAEYKAALADRDQGSYSENVPYLSKVTPYNLHIDPTIATRVEGNAVALATVLTDFDGDARNASTPDIGADEGTFTAVVAAPGIPVYSSPADAAVNVAINAPLNWGANSEGGTPTSYDIYFDTVNPPVAYTNVAVPTYNPAKLFNQTYYWQVKAINAQGDATGPVWSFTTADGVPVLTAPADLAVNVSATPTLTWTAIAGVGEYKVKLGTTPGGSEILNMVSSLTNSYALITPLTYLTTYYWSVYSVNGAQEIQSLERSFTTMDDPVNYVYPYNMDFEEITTAGTLPLHWSKVGTKWSTQVAPLTYNRAPLSGTDYATCAYSSTTSDWLFSRPMQLSAGQPYDFGIWYNTDGLSGWTSLKMYIGASANGAAMTEELASVLAPVNMTYARFERANWVAPTTGVYYIGYQVIATSAPWYLSFDDFYVQETPSNPLPPTAPSPADLAINVNTTADLAWTVNGNTTKVDIYFSSNQALVTAKDPSVRVAFEQAIPLNAFTLGALNDSYSTPYYWMIVAKNDVGATADSPVWSFTTLADPVIYAFPFVESFDGTTFAPLNWTNLKIGGSSLGIWDRQTTGTTPTCAPHSGAAMARYNCYSYQAGTIGILVTPPIAFGADAHKVNFWMYRDTGYPTDADRVNVHYNTSPNLTGATLLGTVNRSTTLAPAVASVGWYEYEFTLPTTGVNAYVIFEGVSAYGNNIFVDDITVAIVPPTPVISIAPASKNFGDVMINTVASQTFTVSNVGGGVLTVSDITVPVGFYSLLNLPSLPATLASGQNFTFDVQYAPTAVGTHTADVTLTDNLARAVNLIPLTGNCYDPAIYSFPYVESFDGTAFAPLGWANVNTSGPGVPGIWDRVTAGVYPVVTPHSGPAMARFASWTYNTGTRANLVTPPLVLTGDTYKVDFWMYRDAEYFSNPDLVNVHYNTAPDLTGATLLGTINRSSALAPVVAVDGWYEYSFNLPAAVGTAYVIFEGVSAYGNDIHVDDVEIALIPPTPATVVAPLDGATGLGYAGQTLTWNPGAGNLPTGYHVYFGASNPPAYIGDQAGTTYPTGALLQGTPYYWQIVPYNLTGDAANCPVWSFTTRVEYNPNPAENPVPADLATVYHDGAFPYMQTLSWSAPSTGVTPTGYKLVWGANPAVDLLNVLTTTVEIPAYNTYLWQIIPYYTDGGARTEGKPVEVTFGSRRESSSRGDAVNCPIWQFTVTPTPLDPVVLVSPADAATGLAYNAQALQWNPVASVPPVTYDLYFGTASNPPLYLSEVLPGVMVSPLLPNTSYYWYITADNGLVTSVSPIWSFTTRAEYIPNAAENPMPADGLVFMGPEVLPTNFSFGWSPPSSGPTPTGYKFSFNGGPLVDLGDVLIHSEIINAYGAYTWQVVPYYNDNGSGRGDAIGCPIWNFVMTPYIIPTSTISGTVTAYGGSFSVSGVQVTCPGAIAPATVTTGTAGTYSFTVNNGGNYTVTPAMLGYYFSPVNASFNNVQANQTANFLMISAKPNLANYTFPVDLATNVSYLVGALQWNYLQHVDFTPPVAFKVYMPADAATPLDEIPYTVDGDYSCPIPPLAYNTTYTWKVVPYNAEGDAEGVVTWSFTTEVEPDLGIQPGIPEVIIPPAGFLFGGSMFTTPPTTGFTIPYAIVAIGDLGMLPPNPALNGTNTYAVVLSYSNGVADLVIEVPAGEWYVLGHWAGAWHTATPYPYSSGVSGVVVLTGIQFAGKADVPIVLSQGPGLDPTLPVELSSFTAIQTAQNFVNLTWVTESETEILGFNAYRSGTSELNDSYRINPSVIQGTNTSTQHTYSFIDSEGLTNNHTYWYWLESVELSGGSEFFGPVSVNFVIGDDDDPTPQIPTRTALLNAFPNPFNPMTRIPYTLKDGSSVRIDICNLKGQTIRTLVNEFKAAGTYWKDWDGKDNGGNDVTSGIYYYRMSAGKFTSTKKIVLVK